MVFKELFKAVMEQLMPSGNKELIKYFAYNWGQFEDNPEKDPLINPAALFSVQPSEFKSGGRGSQTGSIGFQLQLIYQTYAEADSRASSTAVLDKSLGFLDLMEGVYAKLHNWTPDIDGVSTISCQGIVGDPIANGDLVSITLGFTTLGKITTNVTDPLSAVTQPMNDTINVTS